MWMVRFITCILLHIFIEGYPNIQPDIGIPFLKMNKIPLKHGAPHLFIWSVYWTKYIQL